jgi:Leucine-rich repeat (LRR) protein
LKFSDNSLYELSAISELKNLYYLDVRNNKIAETAKISTGEINNITILNTLKDNYNTLVRYLYISGNLLTDTTAIKWAVNK